MVVIQLLEWAIFQPLERRASAWRQ